MRFSNPDLPAAHLLTFRPLINQELCVQDCFYWDVLEMVRRIFLTGIVLLIPEEHAMMCAAAALV